MPPKRAYRIGDSGGRFPVFSPVGAKLNEGRWHNVGQAVIYASAVYSTALLERRAYTDIRPMRQRFVEIDIRTESYEVLTSDDLPGWDEPDSETARTFGSLWFEECRSVQREMIADGMVAFAHGLEFLKFLARNHVTIAIANVEAIQSHVLITTSTIVVLVEEAQSHGRFSRIQRAAKRQRLP